MDRRVFLKTFSMGLVGSRFLDPADLFASPPDTRAVLSVVKGTDVRRMADAALGALGGMSSFVSRGDVVLVKPNMAWDRTPEQAANTNPDLIAAIVRLAYDAGAKNVKVFDNTCNAARRCYERSGIAEAAAQAGADVSFTAERKFKKTNLAGEVLQEWPVYSEALEVDKIINVPVAKHHSLARLTLSMKNLMGLIGGRRNLLHQKIDTNVVDLAAFFRPTLVVLDAIRILTSNGPQGGSLQDVEVTNTIAASRDPVAIDAFGATLFGLTGNDLPHVGKAHARGLGEKDLTKVKTIERTLS